MHAPAHLLRRLRLSVETRLIASVWPQDKVKRVQAQQQAATGAAYDDVQQLSEALLSLPD